MIDHVDGNLKFVNDSERERFNSFSGSFKKLPPSFSQQAMISLVRIPLSQKTLQEFSDNDIIHNVLIVSADELLVCLEMDDSKHPYLKGVSIDYSLPKDNLKLSTIFDTIEISNDEHNVPDDNLPDVSKSFRSEFHDLEVLDTPTYYIKNNRSRAIVLGRYLKEIHQKSENKSVFRFLKDGELIEVKLID